MNFYDQSMLLKAKFLVKVLTVKGRLKYLGYIVTVDRNHCEL